MAHFAEIDSDSKVIRVLVVPDEQEHRGQEYLADDLGFGGTWIQTSYNHKIRKQYAGVDFKYDADADVFIAPQPFPSWTLDDNHDWQPPTAKPESDDIYSWNEEKLAWEKINA